MLPQTSSTYLEPEFAESYGTWKKTPTPANTQAILKSMNPIIDSAIKTYIGPGNASPNVRTRAKLIMAKSLNTYDPARAKLRTHMMSQLQGLRRISAKENQITYMPEQIAIDIGRLNNAETTLKDRFGRDPTTIELADHTNLSPKRIGYIRQSRPVYSEGTIVNTQSDEGGKELYMPGVETPDSYLAWQEFVYYDLNPTDQLIMEHTLGLHGKKPISNQEVARKLRLSPGAISQRKAKIQQKLDMRDELEIF